MTKISELDPLHTGFTPTLDLIPVVHAGKTWSMRVSDFQVSIDGSNFLPISGGSLTGPLYAYDHPAFDLEVATKFYVDNKIATGGDFLPLTGGTLTGPLHIQHATDANIYVTATGSSWPGFKFDTTTDGTSTGYFETKRKGKTRWGMTMGNTVAEVNGTNQGTNFNIRPFADDGSALPIIFTIFRTGTGWFDGPFSFGVAPKNTVTITPGAAAANPVTVAASGTGGISVASSLYLKGNPVANLEAVPKQYVDGKVGAGLPDGPMDGLSYGRQLGDWNQVIAAHNDVVDGGNF